METQCQVAQNFYGSHKLKNHRTCARNCGHTWTVEITVTGDEDEEQFGFPVDPAKLQGMLLDTAVELNGKDIDKMVKPSQSSLVGLAHWFYERFAHVYQVTEVRVWHDNPTVVAILKGP